MAGLGELTIDLMIEGQPETCKRLTKARWKFSYCSETRFITAEHPLSGKQSVGIILRISRTDFDMNEIGDAIAMMLNGENHNEQT